MAPSKFSILWNLPCIAPLRSAKAAADASLLGGKLTPLGSDRSGNLAGTIPPWTGGCTIIPDGWIAGAFMPDPYLSDEVQFRITPSNAATHASQLSAGSIALLRNHPDFFINVYPTRRSAAAPQDVYDGIAANVSRAQLDPAGPQLGFSGGLNGVPFPILDMSDPLAAGAQCIWNNSVCWRGRAMSYRDDQYEVSGGSIILTDSSPAFYDFPYYRKHQNPADFDGVVFRTFEKYAAPAQVTGEEFLVIHFENPVARQSEVWELLNGQGRIRKVPNVAYDTPAANVDGIANTDEYYGFSDQPDEYDWHYAGKKELLIPYNNNTLFGLPASETIQSHFFAPEAVRWELHRVHVVNAALRPGRRNMLPYRTLYFDEDTYTVAATDAYDANRNLIHAGFTYFLTRPDLPGTFIGNNSVHNLSTGDWTPMSGPYNEMARPSIRFYDALPDDIFDPTAMSASSQY